MKKLFLLFLVLVTGSSYCLGQTGTSDANSPDPKAGLKLVWADEFDYPDAQLDEKWTAENASPSHIVCSRWRENAAVNNGMLRLNNKKETRGGKAWTSASLTSKQDFRYGYFECRYRYAAATGTNNSFWLMSRNQYASVTATTPNSGAYSQTILDAQGSWGQKEVPASARAFEIDINEGHFPSEINTCIHNWGDTKTSNGATSHPSFHRDFKLDKTCDLSKEFHVYGLLWTETELVFYLDGKELRREPNRFCYTPSPIRLSEAILPWAGAITDAIDGTFMEVDYVRVYQ